MKYIKLRCEQSPQKPNTSDNISDYRMPRISNTGHLEYKEELKLTPQYPSLNHTSMG
jgi:hypothetical protein